MKKIINIPVNQDIIKIIALVTMTIDHFGYVMEPSFGTLLRLIGRLSFPLFVFLLVFNLNQKELYKKYIFRLSIFAIITSMILIPLKYQAGCIYPFNIYWNLLLGVTTIYGIKRINDFFQDNKLKYVFMGNLIAFGAIISFVFDYSFFGFIYILSLYGWFKSKRLIFGILTLTASFFMNLIFSFWGILISCIISLIFLLPLSQSDKATHILKPWWLFYAYYPVHLAILYAVRLYY